jgi:hypothetical protein
MSGLMVSLRKNTAECDNVTFGHAGIDITANRLFGPQPRTYTYFCIWEIQVGAVQAELDVPLVSGLAACARSFGLNYADAANAPSSDFQVMSEPDATCLKIVAKSLELSFPVPTGAFQVSVPLGVLLDLNDLAGKTYRKITSVSVPSCDIRLLLSCPSSSNHIRWFEVAAVSFDINLDIYSSPPGWRDSARVQLEFVSSQDALTGRVPFAHNISRSETSTSLSDQLLYIISIRSKSPLGSRHQGQIYLPHPKMPVQAFVAVEEETSTASTDRFSGDSSPRPISFLSEADEELSEAERDAHVV